MIVQVVPSYRQRLGGPCERELGNSDPLATQYSDL